MCLDQAERRKYISQSNESPALTYGLFVYLPEAVDDSLHTWTEQTSGATWPNWRGHITLLNAFRIKDSEIALVDALRHVCSQVEPFEMQLNKVVLRQHLVNTDLQTVMLVEQERPIKETRVFVFRRALLDAIADLIVTGDVTDAVNRRPFHPHISLTIGLPPTEARVLFDAAKRSELSASFQVSQITLVGFDAAHQVVLRSGVVLGQALDD